MAKESALVKAVRYPAFFIILIWAVHVFQLLPGIELTHYGVRPRYVEGLWGILFSPLLHGSFGHLINNSIPFFALGSIIFFFFPRVAWRSIAMIYLLSGVLLWLLGNSQFFDVLFGMPISNGYHIGASGVVYGFVSFVFWTGIFRRNLKSIILALIVLTYYSGMFLGILPNDEGISWEGHLYGAVAGIFVAYWFRSDIEEDEKPKKYSWDLEPQPDETHFLDRDTFEKTKEERRREAEGPNDGWFSTFS